jgi:hypothetical protein
METIGRILGVVRQAFWEAFQRPYVYAPPTQVVVLLLMCSSLFVAPGFEFWAFMFCSIPVVQSLIVLWSVWAVFQVIWTARGHVLRCLIELTSLGTTIVIGSLFVWDWWTEPWDL